MDLYPDMLAPTGAASRPDCVLFMGSCPRNDDDSNDNLMLRIAAREKSKQDAPEFCERTGSRCVIPRYGLQ